MVWHQLCRLFCRLFWLSLAPRPLSPAGMESALLKRAKSLAALKDESRKEDSPTKSEGSKTPAKRVCTVFDKFVKKQEGDVTILKEPFRHSYQPKWMLESELVEWERFVLVALLSQNYTSSYGPWTKETDIGIDHIFWNIDML